MKINIGVGISVLNGYTNVDPSGKDDCLCMDFKSLDAVCDDSSCTEIRGTNALNFVHGSVLGDVLKHWINKLRHGGILIVGGFDIFEISKAVFLSHLAVVDANQILYKDGVCGIYTPNEIVGILHELGLKINKRRVNGNEFVVEACRE